MEVDYDEREFLLELCHQRDISSIKRHLENSGPQAVVSGEFACSIAIHDGYDSITELFFKAAQPYLGKEVDRDYINRGLFRACSERLSTVQLAVRYGADVNFPGAGFNVTGLMRAAEYGLLDVVHFLLSSGADVHKKNNRGYTALHYACYNVADRALSTEVIEVLLRAGCSPYALDSRGLDSPISVLVRFPNSSAAIMKLVEHRADPCFADKAGDTALMTAARARNLEATKLLYRLRCQVNTRNNEGLTALAHAYQSEKPNDAVISFLLAHEATL